MIITELFTTRGDGIRLFRTFSDAGFRIKQVETNLIYDEAIDVENSSFTYIETDIPVEAV